MTSRIRIEPTKSLSVITSAFDLHQSWGRGLAQRPDLLQMKVNLERQGVVLKYLRNQLFPQLDLVGSYGQVGSDRGYSGAVDRAGYHGWAISEQPSNQAADVETARDLAQRMDKIFAS